MMGRKFSLLVVVFMIILSHNVDAEIPRVLSVVFNSSTSGTLSMPNITSLNGEAIFMNIGARSTVNTSVLSVSPEFTLSQKVQVVSNTRLAEIWSKFVDEDGDVNATISTNVSISTQLAHGVRVTGVVDDYVASKGILLNQVSASSINANITTTRNNSLIMAFLYKGTNESIQINNGTLLRQDLLGSANSIFTVLQNASVAGTYNINLNWSTATLSSAVYVEIASEQNGSVSTVSAFNATNTTSNNLNQFASALMNSSKANILWIGDSLVTTTTWNDNRWATAFLKAFNHSTGYSFIVGGAGSSGAGGFISKTDLASFSGNSSHTNVITSNDYWGDGSFFGSLWHGRDFVMKIGSTGFTPGAQDNVISWKANAALFNISKVPDWFTGHNLSVQFGYLYDNNTLYADTFSLRNGTGDGTLYRVYNVTNGSQIIGDSVKNRSLSLLEDKIRLDPSTRQIILSNITGSDNRFFSGSIIKINDEDYPNGIAVAALGQSSTSYQNTYQNASPTSSSKQYLQADLVNYIAMVFDNRSDGDNFVFVGFAAETGTTSAQVERVNNLVGNISQAFKDAGFNSPRFVLVSTWRTDDDDGSKVQAEVFYNVSSTNTNVSLISLYGLTEGIYLNGSNSLQTAWAAEEGYDSILFNNGTVLNISSKRLIDTSVGVHQNDEDSAFFFAYLLNNEILENSASTSNSTNSSSNTSNNDTVVDLGGGVVGGSFIWIKTLLEDDQDLSFKGPISKTLKPGYRIRVKIQGKMHHIGIISSSYLKSEALINISSDLAYQVIMKKGENKKFELNNDNFYDLLINLNSIDKSGSVNLTLSYLHEEIETEEKGDDVIKKDYSNYKHISLLITLALLIVLIILVKYLYKYRTKRTDKKRIKV